MAKLLRDFEVENGGTAPRIHSMDEYFMTEVEKVFIIVFAFVRAEDPYKAHIYFGAELSSVARYLLDQL